MKKYNGDVEITSSNCKEWEKKLRGVEEIGGDLSIYSQAKLEAKSLKSVGGDLYINSQAKLDSLKSVGGNMDIYSQAKLDSLKSVGGDLYINSQAKLDSLKSVGGDLYIYSQVKLDSLKSVGGYLYTNSQAKLDSLKSVGGDLYIYSQVKLDSLKSVGGDLDINSQISNDLAIRLTNNCFKHKWYLSDKANNSLLRVKFPNAEYHINNVWFEKELFDKVRKDKLSAEEVFAITNIEQRRVAYEKMDKVKMKSLKGLKVLSEVKKDGRGKKMRVIEFKIDGINDHFKFLDCVDATTARQYFVGTKEDKCWEAKSKSFGFEKDEINYIKEW